VNDNVITIKEFAELCLLTEKVVRRWAWIKKPTWAGKAIYVPVLKKRGH
jgi:hypothetical protein